MRFFYLPNTSSVCLLFPKKAILAKHVLFTTTQKHYFLKEILFHLFHLFFFLSANIERWKQTMHFFPKTPLLTPQKPAKLKILHAYTLFVILKYPPNILQLGINKKNWGPSFDPAWVPSPFWPEGICRGGGGMVFVQNPPWKPRAGRNARDRDLTRQSTRRIWTGPHDRTQAKVWTASPKTVTEGFLRGSV